MSMIGTIKNFLQKSRPAPIDKPAAEAYDIWSDSYDDQPGNLMLDLDEAIFSSLLDEVDIRGKHISDIGCGTGRHWEKIYDRFPAMLTGYDVSAGMLEKLSIKFPGARTKHINNNDWSGLDKEPVDCIISTLTIAHIENIEKAIASWSAFLKNNGDIIITDFHPAILARGGKRSFRHENRTLAVTNFVHPLERLLETLESCGLKLLTLEERYIDDDVKHYYESQRSIHVFNRYYGMPVIFGLHLRKHGTE